MIKDRWATGLRATWSKFFVPKKTDDLSDLAAAIAAARNEWVSAQQLFECVSEPDLVDQAIYSMEAAERKYMYLLRLAKTGREIQAQE